ncbi:VOC family protein [Gluconacetobacter entanii]|uniref:Glyoxalase n=1 Tax=Gluconacetobacter entanii TaxID=108528 RepID=A0A318PYV9_9PROT|nr:VOC family protein [Gluconacetobacter entanii]PYD60012.1 glyoxalase [Gluconacetobacter entanii]
MKFASTRLIAADINTMVAFYELVTEQPAEWLAPQFAEIVTPGATLAIGSAETVALFREGTAEPGANRTAILEFRVDDVDAVFARLKNKVDVVIEPKLLPWGNRTAQFRDPEGTIISLFTPLTKAARARFGTRRQLVANRSVISIDNIQESGGGGERPGSRN